LSWSLKHPKRYQDLKKLIDLSKKNEFLYFAWLKKAKRLQTLACFIYGIISGY
jgi:hypothetical protein